MWFGLRSIFKYAFLNLGLDLVYWCVSEDNARACSFYDKHHFSKFNNIPNHVLDRYRNVRKLRWYCFSKNDYYAIGERKEILGCKIVKIKTFSTEGAGQISFFETYRECPFDVKRVYYISKVPEGQKRGFHAHKKLKQLIFCPYGEICFVLDNGKEREEIILNNPSIAILIEKPIWREMVWIKEDSVLCVCASEYYDENDYIRDYSSFKEYLNINKE